MSRFSIPFDPRGENIAGDSYFAFHAPDERSTARIGGDVAGNGLVMLGDDDPLPIEMIKQGAALFLELGIADFRHG